MTPCDLPSDQPNEVQRIQPLRNRGKLFLGKLQILLANIGLANHNIFLYGLLMFFFLTLVINYILSQLLQKLIAPHSILLTSRKQRKILFPECTGLWGTGTQYTIYICVTKSDKIMSSIPLIVLFIPWHYVGGRLQQEESQEGQQKRQRCSGPKNTRKDETEALDLYR